MKAKYEIARLQAKLEDGSLPADEPLFTLRGRDAIASRIVRNWAMDARASGTPHEKCEEAYRLSIEMDEWPVSQIPGLPETLEDRREEA